MASPNETEANRALLTKAFEGLEHGDPSHFLPLFDDTIEWRIVGSIEGSRSVKGLANVERDLVGPLFAKFSGPYLNIPELILADGDRVVVLARGHAETKDGKTYGNNYAFVFQLAGGKIVQVLEYMDTKHAEAVLGL